ncbi:STAS domain-containing protein [Kitasatospora paranensis]|uniref:Anti-sigma factor antagonist n=1 Tax=Kitasatospora paranensis TaxID=258053 RepID=A0ABW2FUT7_9ACTN
MNDPAHSPGPAAQHLPGGEIRHTGDGALVCTLTGELDLDAAAVVEPVLAEAVGSGAPLLVLDLSGVEFCDSSGLNLLLRSRADAAAAGMDLRLAAARSQLLRLFEITGTDRVFALEPTLASALAVR